MKIAIIRCLKQEDKCIANKCLDTIKNRENMFKGIKSIQLVGFVSCGGCSGKKIPIRALRLLDEAADKVVLSSCISNNNCKADLCPYFDKIKASLLETVGEEKIIWSTT